MSSHSGIGFFAVICFITAAVFGYINHIVWSISLLYLDVVAVKQGMLAIGGLIVPPVAVIHGLGRVLGFWDGP